MKTIIIEPSIKSEQVNYSEVTEDDVVIAVSSVPNSRKYIVRHTNDGYAVYNATVNGDNGANSMHRSSLKEMFEFLKDHYTFYLL